VKIYPAHFFAQSISEFAGKWIQHLLNRIGSLAFNKNASVFARQMSRRGARLTTVPAAIKYSALVSFLASHSLGEVLFGNSHVQSAVA
jgi:hypothetical protein